MNISPNTLARMIEFEGFEPRAYKDFGGTLYIGVGHLLTEDEISSGKIYINGKSVNYEKGLSPHGIMKLLAQDLERYENAVNEYVEVPLTQNQFDTLICFSFNVGICAFKHSTLLKRLNEKRYDDVPAELRRKRLADFKMIQGMMDRREKEIQLWSAK